MRSPRSPTTHSMLDRQSQAELRQSSSATPRGAFCVEVVRYSRCSIDGGCSIGQMKGNSHGQNFAAKELGSARAGDAVMNLSSGRCAA
eukprot:scaffold256_cov261-Pinguiococcus_pyrenoidosus.AAC.16